MIKRVAEMQQLVEDAENYLSDADGETTETESVRSDQYGRLKHSDSLLLLTQVCTLYPESQLHSRSHQTYVRKTVTSLLMHIGYGSSLVAIIKSALLGCVT